jgi:hypothetical protein
MTPRQAETLAFLREKPGATYEEIRVRFGLKRRSGCVRLVQSLVEQGLVDHATKTVIDRPLVPRGSMRFIAIGSREPGAAAPTACTDRYPFEHPTCAEWMFDPRHGSAV